MSPSKTKHLSPRRLKIEQRRRAVKELIVYIKDHISAAIAHKIPNDGTISAAGALRLRQAIMDSHEQLNKEFNLSFKVEIDPQDPNSLIVTYPQPIYSARFEIPLNNQMPG